MLSKKYDPTTSSFRLETSPFYLMAHADFRYHEDMETVMAKRGLNKTIYRILTVLRETEASSVSELSDIALTKRTTVSRIVDRMTQMGLTSTAPLATDARVTEVRMTDKGRAVLDELTPIVRRQFERATQGIAKADLDHLVETLAKIGTNLTKLSIE